MDGLLCLDRNQTVRNPLGIGSSLEICDLLGPENELIHVKRAKGSAPLSHLFSQGLNSAQSLIAGPAVVREQFIQSVASVPHGRSLPCDFKPTKVVYAILLENGKATYRRHAVPVLPGDAGTRCTHTEYLWNQG